jgi:cell volume regulation protein A
MVSEESAHRIRDLVGRWQTGPIGPPPRPPRAPAGRRPIFTVWTWNTDRDGDATRPQKIGGQTVSDQLRIRRDEPGGLWVLADGRYAVTGPLAAIGSRGDLTDWARRRTRHVGEDERAWLQNVIGALAADRE